MSENPIALILAEQVIPSITENDASQMVVARPSFSKFRKSGSLPLGMKMTQQPLKSRRVKVRGKQFFGKMLVNARWNKDGLHSLRTPKLAIVLNGNITFQCGDALLHCKPGHIIFMPPDIPHSDGSHNYLEETEFFQGNCDVLFVGIHAEGLAVWHSRTRRGDHSTADISLVTSKHAQDYLNQIWEQSMRSGKYARRKCGALLLLLMISIYEELLDARPMQSQSRVANKSNDSEVAERVQEYVHHHVHENLTINKVARHVYLSRTQFTSQFRRETGQSFLEFLTHYRLEKAKVLLGHPFNLPINRVASRIGLTPDMLRKLFRKHLQMTPSQFREKQEEIANKNLTEK